MVKHGIYYNYLRDTTVLSVYLALVIFTFSQILCISWLQLTNLLKMSHASYIVLQIMTNSQISPHGTLRVSMTKPWLVSSSVNHPLGFVVTSSCIDVYRCFLSFFWAYVATEQEPSQALYMCRYHCRHSWTQNVAHTSSAGPLVLLSPTAASDSGQSICPPVTEVTP